MNEKWEVRKQYKKQTNKQTVQTHAVLFLCVGVCMYSYLIGTVGGGVQLGPLGTAVTNRHIVPAPGDHDDGEIGGMMIGRENWSSWRKPAPVPLCPPQTPHACPDANPGHRRGKLATNSLSYGTAMYVCMYVLSCISDYGRGMDWQLDLFITYRS
jgi:hypothetical protein